MFRTKTATLRWIVCLSSAASIASIVMKMETASNLLTAICGLSFVLYVHADRIQRIPIAKIMGDAFRKRQHEYFRDGIDVVSFAVIINVSASVLAALHGVGIPSWVLLNFAIIALAIFFTLLLIVKPT